jgi:predicted glycoside hydrolase/deacetylase ChbG (UPF0249 family)
MDAMRHLLVIADDFGIGLQTSRGILDLAARGLVTGTVLLANSTYAPASVATWRRMGAPADLGWHACLTLDKPVAPPGSIASLVDFDGNFWPLGKFVRRLCTGRIRSEHIYAELFAQYRRFVELVGRPPRLVNSHQHVALFKSVGDILIEVLKQSTQPTYVRRVREPWSLLRAVSGARRKRLFLRMLGPGSARRFDRAGYAGADCFAGLSQPAQAAQTEYLSRWLSHAPGQTVELMCHPGHLDPSLAGRDGTAPGGSQPWRVHEYHRLSDPRFAEACERARFRRMRPSEWLDWQRREQAHAA